MNVNMAKIYLQNDFIKRTYSDVKAVNIFSLFSLTCRISGDVPK